jgi:hypothetical protein
MQLIFSLVVKYLNLSEARKLRLVNKSFTFFHNYVKVYNVKLLLTDFGVNQTKLFPRSTTLKIGSNKEFRELTYINPKFLKNVNVVKLENNVDITSGDALKYAHIIIVGDGTLRRKLLSERLSGLDLRCTIVNVNLITSCVNLKCIYFNKIKSDDLFSLKNLTNLRELALCMTRVKNTSFLCHLTKLRKLEMNCNYLDTISDLTNLTKLTHLWLFACKTDLMYLENLKNLRVLVLVDCTKFIAVVEKLPLLTSLNLRFSEILDIRPARNVKYLSLCSTNFNENMVYMLEEFQNLTVLDLCESLINDFSGLIKLTKLQKLDVRETVSEHRKLLELNKCTNLKNIMIDEYEEGSNWLEGYDHLNKVKNTSYKNLDEHLPIGLREYKDNWMCKRGCYY